MTHPENIETEELVIGTNSFIEPSAKIRGLKGKAKRIVIGDNVYIGADVQIICDYFSLGDYSKIHHHTNVHGYKPCTIGHNAWIGQYTIIDSIGGTTIGDNLGVGAHSQLWSHIKYGDTLEGCRFLSEKQLIVGNDVWFVGHCIVSPIKAEDKSMALVGSVVTKDMKYNNIYAGNPAISLSDKIGNQFIDVSLDEKMNKMSNYLISSGVNPEKVKIIEKEDDIVEDNITYFIVSKRKYTKNGSIDEIKFMNYLLPDKAKFTPL